MSITEKQFRQLLDKYLRGETSPEETHLLDQFFDSYREFQPESSTASEKINDRVRREILQAMGRRINLKDEKVRQLSMAGFWLPVAASVSVVLIALYLFFSPSIPFLQNDAPAPVAMIEQSAAKGEKTDVLLPDGSRIKLNADSKLSFPKVFDQHSREVTLAGEAYFEIVHDASKPFVVHTAAGSTKVLGTSFNIKAHHGRNAEITLVEGSVNVSSRNGPDVLLSPGQQATIVSGTQRITTRVVDVAQYTAWKNNTLYFDRVTLKEALAAMEPWYDVSFNVANPALERCIITAQYQDEPIENVLQSLKFLLNVDFKINQRQITVTGTGCK